MTAARIAWASAGFGVRCALAGCGGSTGGGGTTTPPPAISVAFSGALPSSIPVGGSANLTAVVMHTANSAITWSVTCGSAGNCGSFPVNEGALDTVSYTAPPVIPSGKTVTVTATSVADTTKSASATMTVTAGISFLGALPAVLQVNQTMNVGAEIGAEATSTTTQAQWTLSCGGASCGSFNPCRRNLCFPAYERD